MYPRSAAFDAAVVDSHTPTCTVELLQNGIVIASGLEVTGGDVAVDATAAVRRHCGLTLVDPTGQFTPAGSTPSRLSPYGNEVKLYRGIDGLDSIPLGVFRIANPVLEDSGARRRWTITGYDRSRTVSRSRFTDAYVVASGTNYVSAIESLIDSILPGLAYRAVSTGYSTPQLVFDAESDPWQAALTMAASIGFEVYFDPDGACVIQPEPDPTTANVAWRFAEGATATLLSASRNFDDDPGYNGVVVFGETPDNTSPVRAESWDNNPSSPTYYLGGYGKRPTFIRSTYVTTTAQAQDAADANVRRLLGVTEQVQMSAIPHPALEAGDVVGVTRAAVGLDDVFAVESFSMPLSYEQPMQVTMRRRKATV